MSKISQSADRALAHKEKMMSKAKRRRRHVETRLTDFVERNARRPWYMNVSRHPKGVKRRVKPVYI